MRLASGVLLALFLSVSSAFAQDGVELRGGIRVIGALGGYERWGYLGADVSLFRGIFAGGDLSVLRGDTGGRGWDYVGLAMVHGGYRYTGRLAGVLQPYARLGGGRTVWQHGTGVVMGGVGTNVWLSDAVSAHFDYQRLKVLDSDISVPLHAYTVGVTYAPPFFQWRER